MWTCSSAQLSCCNCAGTRLSTPERLFDEFGREESEEKTTFNSFPFFKRPFMTFSEIIFFHVSYV